MGDHTKIQWADATWAVSRGCSRVSAGCQNCYAERVAARFNGKGQPYEGLVKYHTIDETSLKAEPRWTEEVRFLPNNLAQPLRWRRPRRIFVNSTSDLFHAKLTDEQIAAVFGVMAAAPQHTFQVLTKRPERMRAWFEWLQGKLERSRAVFPDDADGWIARHLVANRARHLGAPSKVQASGDEWPFPNVHLGVSIESPDQMQRALDLMGTPAAVRWVSLEPLLADVSSDLAGFLSPRKLPGGEKHRRIDRDRNRWVLDPDGAHLMWEGLDWVVVGGESGPGARPCNVAWIRSIVEQCSAAGVACFVKQLGANVRESTPQHGWNLPLCDRKGGDPAEWPEALRVQEFPA